MGFLFYKNLKILLSDFCQIYCFVSHQKFTPKKINTPLFKFYKYFTPTGFLFYKNL